MNKLTKILLSTAIVAAIGIGVGVAKITTASADELSTYPPIVQRLAEKFNLNQADVQAVFDEQRQANEQTRQQNISDRLDQAVTDGQITADQKTAILNEVQSVQTQIDDMRNLTGIDRQLAMDNLRTQVDQWLKDNNITLPFPGILGEFGHGFRGGMMHEGWGMGMMHGYGTNDESSD